MEARAQLAAEEESPSDRLARFVAGLELAAVPAETVDYARLLMLDLLGAALAGVETEETRAMLAAARGFAPAAGPCAVWGGSREKWA